MCHWVRLERLHAALWHLEPLTQQQSFTSQTLQHEILWHLVQTSFDSTTTMTEFLPGFSWFLQKHWDVHKLGANSNC